jgi:ABC-type transport system involved in cytochrome bd biosynthesis fused ATPase/permease subunit
MPFREIHRILDEASESIIKVNDLINIHNEKTCESFNIKDNYNSEKNIKNILKIKDLNFSINDNKKILKNINIEINKNEKI